MDNIPKNVSETFTTNSTLDLKSTSTIESELADNLKEKVPVQLNVYGLTKMNQKINEPNLCACMVGVEVNGIEWSYGQHQYPISGIFTLHKPRDLKSLSKEENLFNFVGSITLGQTWFGIKKITYYLTELGRNEWIGLRFHIVFKNSIHFAGKFASYLCGATIPAWVNSFPILNYKFPELLQDIPVEYRTPLALKEIIDQKVNYALKYQQERARIKQAKQKMTQMNLNKLIKICTIESNSYHQSNEGKAPSYGNKVVDGQRFKHENISELLRSLESDVDFFDSKIFAAPSIDDLEHEFAKMSKAKN